MKQKNEQEVSAVLQANPPKGLCINPALHKTLQMKFDIQNKPLARSICGSPILYKDFKDKIKQKKDYMKKQETMKIIQEQKKALSKGSTIRALRRKLSKKNSLSMTQKLPTSICKDAAPRISSSRLNPFNNTLCNF